MPTKLQQLVLDSKRLAHLPDIHLMICSNLSFTDTNFLETGIYLSAYKAMFTYKTFSFVLAWQSFKPTWRYCDFRRLGQDLPVCRRFQLHTQVMARVPDWEGKDCISFQNCLLLHNFTLFRHPSLNVIRISFGDEK